MYHENFQNAAKVKKSTNDIHTGYYSFHYAGGLITGNVIRIGETTVIKTLTIGTIEMNTLSFIDSNPQKL